MPRQWPPMPSMLGQERRKIAESGAGSLRLNLNRRDRGQNQSTVLGVVQRLTAHPKHGPRPMKYQQ
ncbi:hypothetical protein B9Z19DRAFT_1083332 [Tuber borchii]|uniref:Uncharacterized protein n=1 Tax=Tuber borchii TaxID=42251 RepID=A0A2T6ZTE9_TUBBO|nr:hypothetical protein B9Z19DRAFT_1083332 [Tuber borchii]